MGLEAPQTKSFGLGLSSAPESGLRNLGNTCYLNSVIQALKPLNLFRSALSIQSSISNELIKLYEEMDRSSVVSPTKFVEKMRDLNPNWGNGRPQDSKEFLLFLIKNLNDERVESVFAWKIKKTLKLRCRCVINLDEKLILISLPRGELRDSIMSSFEKRRKSEKNEYPNFYCEKCCSENLCIETREVAHPPPKYAIFYREPTSRYIESLSQIQELEIGQTTLQLKSVILLHTWTETMRHYTALCRKNRTWTLYDDSYPQEFRQNDVSGGYLFFYELVR